MERSLIRTVAAGAAVALLAACGGDDETRGPGEMAQRAGGSGDAVTLTGAGATFPYPVYSRWFSDYAAENPVRVNYQSIGSGGGIRQVTEGTVDFGASDAPMNDEEMAAAPDVMHLPMVLGAVAVAYNAPGVDQPIRMTGEVVADVFRGEITRWNHPRLAQLNPGVRLPDEDILVVTRTDGSGTTYVFTEYLSQVSPAWRDGVGTGKSVQWPVGLGAKGNEGVTGQISQHPGAVGYVELAYARQNDLAVAAIENRAGEFVAPSPEATTAAAAGVADRLTADTDFRLSIVDAEGAEAYPISTWTYLLVPRHFESCEKADALARVVRWSLSEGGAAATELDYAPLPDAVRDRVLERLGTVTCGADDRAVASS